MENKTAKSNLKKTKKMKSVRISLENHFKSEKFRTLANKKKTGGTIKFDHVVGIALDLLTEDHVKRLQDQSLSNEDRKELLRQKWGEIYGPVSKEAYTGITFTKEYQTFLSTLSESGEFEFLKSDSVPVAG